MAIVKALQLQRGLVIFTAHIHPECDLTPVAAFKKFLKRGDWILSEHGVYYPNFWDSIADSSMFIIGIQRTYSYNRVIVVCLTPPDISGRTLGEFVYLPFNKHEVSVSPARTDGGFRDSYMVGSNPYSEAAAKRHTVSKRIYNLHRVIDNHSVIAGTSVYFLEGICPPLCLLDQNIFGCVFGIEFEVD